MTGGLPSSSYPSVPVMTEMISSPGCRCRPNAAPGAKSTRTWTASRPGALRSCRCRSVRLIPGCWASANGRGKMLPTISPAAAIVRIVLTWVSSRSRSAQLCERRAQLGREQLRLLPGGEVAAFVDLVEIDEVAVGTLGPTLRRAVDLAWKHRHCDRDRYVRGLLTRGVQDRRGVLPVEPRGRNCAVRQPVERDVVQDRIACQASFG